METTTVRVLSGSDWKTYRTLRLAALAESPDAFAARHADALGRSEALWKARLSDVDPASSRPVVALCDGTPCGLCWTVVNARRSGTADLYQMWVDPAFRGRGIGAALLADAVDWAVSNGLRAIDLHCTASNGAAIALYRAGGFVPTGASSPLRDGSDLSTIGMRRSLPAPGSPPASGSPPAPG